MTDPKKSAPKNRKAPLSPARKAAFDVLIAVEKGHSHSDDLLRGKAANALSPADRNLATTLVLGVLRWQIRLDRELRVLLKHPKAKLEPEILIALRLGAFQLLHLDRIPARAAIDESVELAKQAGHRFASGMVNAVLRKLNSAPRVHLPEENLEELALATGHPGWMVERWAGIYGMEATRAICRHGQSQPALTVRIESDVVDAELTAAAIHAVPGELLTVARTVVSGDVLSSPAYHEGRIRFQDEGSQLVAELASVVASRTAKSILDCCAAPGGKTLILAKRCPDARIVACEASPQRLDALRKRLLQHAGQIECRLADAAVLEEESTFDIALADVPCSGTGTLGRNPEIRHRLRLGDLERQAERQRGILRAALRAVRPGGFVVYSTCSLEPEENENVVAAVLEERPDALLISFQSTIECLLKAGILTTSGAQGLLRCLAAEGTIRLLPGALHTDGFFIALIQRVN
ncbi:MAG: transcription antitermination factor NusB [Terracidiphilus sp.]